MTKLASESAIQGALATLPCPAAAYPATRFRGTLYFPRIPFTAMHLPLLPLALISLAALPAVADEQDCRLDILHSAIKTTHTFNLTVSCRGNYTPLTYLLRAKRRVNGVTLTDSQSGTLNIHGDSKTVGDIQIDLKPGDHIELEGRILQACEVLGETRLEFTR